MFKALAVLLVCGLGLLGQTAINPKDAAPQKQLMIRVGDAAEFGPIGITTAMAGPMATVTGAPYSAQATTERVQILADGNRIVQSTSGTVARDSQGRFRKDEALPFLSAGKTGDSPHMVYIQDPVAGVQWNLDARMKIAFKSSFSASKMQGTATKGTVLVPPPIGQDRIWFTSELPAPPSAHSRAIGKSQTLPDTNVSKTDLGTQTVEGVPAQGTRMVRTIPAGEVGNEQPLFITTETWYSADLKVLVMSKTNDPRMGETTYRLTDIQRAEPPASLFEVPEDYKVEDQPTGPITLKAVK
ncbi:MAG: hypothetical protein JO210_08185 [Acidobacteriaceae bacterium]|nr:hypothetical protein [Acidobacteriaceae bacterium]